MSKDELTREEKIMYATYDNITVVKPYMKYIMGGNTPAILFAHILFWLDVARKGKGKYSDMVYKTNLELEFDTGLSNTEVKVSKKKLLQKFESITTVQRGTPKKTHYKIDWNLFDKELSDYKIEYYDSMPNKWDKRRSLIMTKNSHLMWDVVGCSKVKMCDSKDKLERVEPEVIEPEVIEPEVAEPEVAEPEVAEPEVAEVVVTEGETPEIDTAEPKKTPKKKSKSIPLELKNKARVILDYLNHRTNRRFRDVDSNLKYIVAKFRQGYVESEMKYVIDNKNAEWGGDKVMDKYLRPETLFAGKFDSYLNEMDIRKDKEYTMEDYVREAEEALLVAPFSDTVGYRMLLGQWILGLSEEVRAYLLLTKRMDKIALEEDGLRPSIEVMRRVATDLGLNPNKGKEKIEEAPQNE